MLGAPKSSIDLYLPPQGANNNMKIQSDYKPFEHGNRRITSSNKNVLGPNNDPWK